MKRKIYLLVMAIAAVLFAMPARAFDLGDVRVNARFLTPDFVNAYPKNHQRIEVRYVDAVS